MHLNRERRSVLYILQKVISNNLIFFLFLRSHPLFSTKLQRWFSLHLEENTIQISRCCAAGKSHSVRTKNHFPHLLFTPFPVETRVIIVHSALPQPRKCRGETEPLNTNSSVIVFSSIKQLWTDPVSAGCWRIRGSLSGCQLSVQRGTAAHLSHRVHPQLFSPGGLH